MHYLACYFDTIIKFWQFQSLVKFPHYENENFGVPFFGVVNEQNYSFYTFIFSNGRLYFTENENALLVKIPHAEYCTNLIAYKYSKINLIQLLQI